MFPAPSPPTYNGDHLVGELLYVPKDFNYYPAKYISEGPRNSECRVLNDMINKPTLPPQAKFYDHQGNIIVKDDAKPAVGQMANYSADSRDYVPCLFLPCLKGSSKLIIFFHGNAEDLGISYEMLDHMRTALRVNLMAVEYPGYGIYDDPEGPSEEKIYRDAELVYNFV